jgi:hypothetical protein
VAAAVRTREPGPRDEALAALDTLRRMCESSLLDKIPEFDGKLKKLQTILTNLEEQPGRDSKSSMALTMAIARFMTQAQALVSYFHRHNSSSRFSSADGADFVQRFQTLQLGTLEETLRLYQFLAG